MTHDPAHTEQAPLRRRLLRRSAVLFVLALLIWTVRFPILRGLGRFLIHADTECSADAIYVLGGSPYDRGTYAARLLQDGCAQIAYTTGSNIPSAFMAEGRIRTEADVTRSAAVQAGAASGSVLPFPYGTSTWEEAAGVLYHSRALGFDTIALVTTDFHTRRVRQVFQQRFAGSGIAVRVIAAPSSDYTVDEWFRSEQGLLMVNNEYVKTLYYAITY
ncbi:MAG: YdcF family protein [Flavobacteriales bacterium]|nr:YdcF family protein [Flavobacteriales bacterium]